LHAFIADKSCADRNRSVIKVCGLYLHELSINIAVRFGEESRIRIKNKYAVCPINKRSVGGTPDKFNVSVQTDSKFPHVSYLFPHTEWAFTLFSFSQVPNRPPTPTRKKLVVFINARVQNFISLALL
jgi:hypothetical protein